MDTKILEKLIKDHVGGYYSQSSEKFKKQFLKEVWKDCTNLRSELEQLQNKDEEAFINRLYEVIFDLFGKPKSADRENSFNYNYLKQKNQVIAEYLQRIAFKEDIIRAHRGIGESVFQDVYQEAFEQFEKWKGITRITNDDEWRRKTRNDIMQKYLEHAKDRELYFSGENREDLIGKFAYRDYLYHVKQSSFRANQFTGGLTKSMVFHFQIEYLNSLLNNDVPKKEDEGEEELPSLHDLLFPDDPYKVKKVMPKLKRVWGVCFAMADTLIQNGYIKEKEISPETVAKVLAKDIYEQEASKSFSPDDYRGTNKYKDYFSASDEKKFSKHFPLLSPEGGKGEK